MNGKEIFKEIFDSFFVIFTVAIIGLVIYRYLFGQQIALLNDIVAIFIASVLTTLFGVVLYSKREPRQTEMIIRYLVHAILIFGTILGIATYMGWIDWNEPITVIRFLVLIAVIFVSVHAIIFYRTKQLADKLNEKLKARYNR